MDRYGHIQYHPNRARAARRRQRERLICILWGSLAVAVWLFVLSCWFGFWS